MGKVLPHKQTSIYRISALYSILSIFTTLMIILFLYRRLYIKTPIKWNDENSWNKSVNDGLKNLLTVLKQHTSNNNLDLWPISETLYSSLKIKQNFPSTCRLMLCMWKKDIRILKDSIRRHSKGTIRIKKIKGFPYYGYIMYDKTLMYNAGCKKLGIEIWPVVESKNNIKLDSKFITDKHNIDKKDFFPLQKDKIVLLGVKVDVPKHSIKYIQEKFPNGKVIIRNDTRPKIKNKVSEYILPNRFKQIYYID